MMECGSLDSFIVGNSVGMRRLRESIARIAPTRLSVLIEGPTGAGKELVARALHRLSGRRGRLVAFNVSAINDALFEDALFGHVRGAFTGASTTRKGYLGEADHGSIFLDEVATLPMAAQAKLLRAIETGEFRPVGADRDHQSNFRVVGAANEDLAALVRAGSFRLDLLHRLTGVRLRIPPLCERMEDISELALHFARTARPDMNHSISLTACAVDELSTYHWPGNVRELKHVVERAAMLNSSAHIDREMIRAAIDRHPIAPPSAHDAVGKRLAAVLERHSWDARSVASELGVHHSTVYRWIRRWEVPMPPTALRRVGR